MTNREKLWGLCLTAAMEINYHPEIGVVLGGSESGRDVVQMMQLIIHDTIVKGMDFVEPPAPAPAPAPAPLVIGLDPLDIRCVCGHLWRNHYAKATGEGGECRGCECEKFDSGYTDEVPHAR